MRSLSSPGFEHSDGHSVLLTIYKQLASRGLHDVVERRDASGRRIYVPGRMLLRKTTRTAQYAAVAAKTSCLCAFVKMLSTALKNKVNSRMTTILMVPDSSEPKSTTTGTMRRATARMVMMRRTNVSIRLLL